MILQSASLQPIRNTPPNPPIDTSQGWKETHLTIQGAACPGIQLSLQSPEWLPYISSAIGTYRFWFVFNIWKLNEKIYQVGCRFQSDRCLMLLFMARFQDRQNSIQIFWKSISIFLKQLHHLHRRKDVRAFCATLICVKCYPYCAWSGSASVGLRPPLTRTARLLSLWAIPSWSRQQSRGTRRLRRTNTWCPARGWARPNVHRIIVWYRRNTIAKSQTADLL